MDSNDVQADLKHVLYTKEQIQSRIAELAAQIDKDYEGRDILMVGVLKGAVMVMADLARALHSHVSMDWMAVSSYGSGTQSSGVVRILKDLDTDLMGKDVLIVEDIIDSGLTLSWLKSNLESRGTASVEICTAFRKPAAAKVDVKGDDAHPFYKWAKEEVGEPAEPVWNFHKLLVGKDGKLINVFGPRTTPDDPEVVKAIEEAL